MLPWPSCKRRLHLATYTVICIAGRARRLDGVWGRQGGGWVIWGDGIAELGGGLRPIADRGQFDAGDSFAAIAVLRAPYVLTAV